MLSDGAAQRAGGRCHLLQALDSNGLEFEVFWTVPGGRRALDLEDEVARRGIPMPEEIDDVALST